MPAGRSDGRAGVLPLVVRAGGGSARQALTVSSSWWPGPDRRASPHATRSRWSAIRIEVPLDGFIDALAIGDGGSMFGAMDQALRVNDDGVDPGHESRPRLRDLVILVLGSRRRHARADRRLPRSVGETTVQAALLGAAQAIRLADAIAAALARMQGNVAPRLVLELCCARATFGLTGGTVRSVRSTGAGIPS